MNNNRHLKKSSKIAILLLCTGLLMLEQPLWAQAPQAISYQAIARDNNGIPLAETDVTVIFNIRAGSPSGVTEYREQHQAETNKFGLFTLNIGQGSPLAGNFVNIDWSAGDKYLQTEINGTLNGTTQLLSVPYAFFAQKAPDQQNLSINGTTLSISGGNAVQLPAGSGATTLDGLNDVSAPSPSNGQVLQWNGTAWVAATPSIGGTYNAGSGIVINSNTISAVDISASNEIQNLSLNGTTLSISGGNAVQLPAGTGATTLDGLNDVSAPSPSNGQILQWNGTAWVAATPSSGGTFNAGSGIIINGNTISASDISASNEIQNLSINGTTLSISGGNAVQLPAGSGATTLDGLNDVSASSPANGQVLQWNGSAWVAATPSSGGTFNAGSGIVINGNTISASDADPTNEIQLISLVGNQLTLNKGGGTVTLPITNYTEGTAIQIIGNQINNTGDPNPLDDITTNTTAGGDINGTYPNPSVVKIRGRNISSTTPVDGQVLKFNASSNQWEPSNDNTGASDWQSTPTQIFTNGKLVAVNNTNGNPLMRVGNSNNFPPQGNNNNAGVLVTYGPSSKEKTIHSYLTTNPDYGVIAAYSNKGYSTVPPAFLGVNPDTKSGVLQLNTDGGTSRVTLGAYTDDTLSGFVRVHRNGNPAADLGCALSGEGFAGTLGPNGLFNTYAGATFNAPNNGYMGVFDAAGLERAAMYIRNTDNQSFIYAHEITATIKNFKITNPEDPNREIWYACLEGPEAAIYERGTAMLLNGRAEVKLSEHFALMMSAGTMTVQVTPHSADTDGLAVVEKTLDGFIVKELRQGKGNFTFDWEVKAVRKGFEGYQVDRMRLEPGAIPPRLKPITPLQAGH